MDRTALARELLEPVPANRLLGVRVLRAGPDGAEVALEVRTELENVVGSLHASGLAGLADAAGLAAIVGALPRPDALRGIGVLGAAAELRFRAPARGLLRAGCALDPGAADELRAFLAGDAERLRLATEAVVRDEADHEVCTGAFDWRLRRTG